MSPFGAGSNYLEQLYDQYLQNPASLPEEWQRFFAGLSAEGQQALQPDASHSHRAMLARMAPHKGNGGTRPVEEEAGGGSEIEYPSRALYMIHGYRIHGHLHADLDPLHLNPVKPSPELEPSYYGLSQADMEVSFRTGDLTGPAQMRLADILAMLKQTYCGHIGPEFMHITDSVRKLWLQDRLETIRSKPDYDDDTRRHIYSRIMQAEELERFLHTRYAGQKRFSLEGGESLIPMLGALIQRAGTNGVKEILIGMAHRGRLNVLANIIGKELSYIFAEFEGNVLEESALGQGDVKYHQGFSSDVRTPGGVVHLSLAFNPSHLEAIMPVILGSVRARQCRRGDKRRRQVMPLLIHGDAAFAGQGVVAESLNLSNLRGFHVGGTVHVVVNNHIGFTVNPFDARSTVYATDIAKMVQAPILHVNGDDPEACCLAAEIAFDYRNHFNADIVIDLVCYRRHGHNEADSPDVTQPVMYRKIAERPSTGHLYRDQVIADGLLSKEAAEQMVRDYRECLDKVRKSRDVSPPSRVNSLQGRWLGYLRDDPVEPETAVPAQTLAELIRRVQQLPEGFSLHPRVEKIYEARLRMMDGDEPVDWGCAETMAYATLVHEGGWVRLSGQDSGRGTFFHRHAVVYDQQTGKGFVPLRQVENGDLSHFIVIDSMLSELAALGFEYGYALAEPRALVVWEAQFGDFANNAQCIIDQFIAAGETKWERMCGLVLWLPHGYEGQGPEHSSARLERYLQLCADNNMQVAYPTTPVQLFHLLRRQVMRRTRKPLVIMGPKSMLRLKPTFSTLEEFTSGGFRAVLGEQDDGIKAETVRRVILCSGKVYYDLLQQRQERKISDVALLRIERLYPFPFEELKAELAKYAAEDVVWVQEEPENQGAWCQSEHRIEACLQGGQRLRHLARPASSSPAVGSSKRHQKEQSALVDAALGRE